MTSPDPRPPFDSEDAATADRYLRSRGLTAFNPFAGEDATQDSLLANSLAIARWMVEQSFGTSTEAGRSFRGYPVIVDSAHPNAFVIDFEGLQILGLNVGLAASLFEISMFAFAQSTLFTDIGDASRERSPTLPPGSALSFWMSDQLRMNPAANSDPVGAELIPRDSQRQLAAHLLTQLMLRFAWLHELYHALNGHSGLLAVRENGAALSELREREGLPMVETKTDDPDPVWRLTLHCMEFDADRTALWTMTRMQEAEFEPLTALAALPKAVRLRLVLFAGFMMTFLFDQSARRQLGGSSGSHPLAYHRLHNLVRTLASNLLDADGAVRAAFGDVLGELTRLRECLPELFSTAQILADLRASNLQAAFDRVDEALEAARFQFRPYAFSAASRIGASQ